MFFLQKNMFFQKSKKNANEPPKIQGFFEGEKNLRVFSGGKWFFRFCFSYEKGVFAQEKNVFSERKTYPRLGFGDILGGGSSGI